jgi:GGDEF domain-containing protein
VSASIGYALAPGDARQPLNLLQLADDAMYAAKRFGKNRAMHCASISFAATR